MAVAPVAVEMRHRNKRRLTTGAFVVAVAAVAAAGLLLFFGRANQDRHNGHTPGEVFGTFGAFGVAYGVHGSQLLTRFGAPDQKRDGCWIYRIRGGAFHGIKLIPQIAGMDAVRYCFFSGVVGIIEDHWRPGMKNSPFPGPWTAPVTFGCAGKPCQLQHAP